MRIEVDGAHIGGSEPAEFDQPTGGPNWPVLIGLVALIAIAVAFVALRPDANEAADGTERVAPTTSVPNSTTEQSTETTVVSPAESAPELLLADSIANSVLSGDAVFAVRADLGEQAFGVQDVVQTNDGFLALAPTESVERPMLFRSDDGVSWIPIEVSISNERGADLASLTPVELFSVGGQLGLLAQPLGDSEVSSEVLVSSDGARWEVPENTGIEFSGPQALALLDDAILTVEVLGRPLDEVLATHTDLPLDGVSICGAGRQPSSQDPRLDLFNCAAEGSASFLLGEQNIVGDVPADAVLDCVAAHGRSQSGLRSVFRSLGLGEQAESGFGPSTSVWNFVFEFANLRNGDLAIYNRGGFDDESCVGVVDLAEAASTPSIVVLGADGVREEIFELPVDARFVEILGDGQLAADGASHLLVTLDRNVWGLNTSSGEWTRLTANDTGRSFGEFIASESGNRFYEIATEGLIVSDLFETDDGALLVSTQALPIERDNPTTVPAFLGSTLLFANDDEIFITDLDRELWLIGAPPLPGERELEAPGGQGDDGSNAVFATLSDLEPQLLDTELPSGPRDVLRSDEGFLALPSVESVDQLTLFESDDGVFWTPIETSVSDDQGLDLASLRPTELFATTDRLGLRAASDETAELFTSSDGALWEVPTDIEVSGPQPLALQDDSIITVEVLDRPLDELLATHTDLPLDGVSICAVSRFPSQSIQLELVDCVGNSSFILGGGNVVGDVPAEVVLDCLVAHTLTISGARSNFGLVGLDGENESGFGSPLSSWNFGFGFTTLGNGDLAIHNIGGFDNESCIGLVDLPDAALAPSIVVLRPDGLSESVFALPVDAIAVQLLGEARVSDGGAATLLVTLDGNVWALNVNSGEWTRLTETIIETGRAFSEFVLSESGNRLYEIVNGYLIVSDLLEAEDGSLSVSGRALAIQTRDPSIVPSFFGTRILFASDDQVFMTELGGRLWVVGAPPLPGDRELEIAEDQGGVGISRVR